MFADVFKTLELNVSKEYREYELDPTLSFVCAWISMAACLKMAAVTFELLTDIDMLLMGEKELEVEYVMHYIGVQKQIIST